MWFVLMVSCYIYSHGIWKPRMQAIEMSNMDKWTLTGLTILDVL